MINKFIFSLIVFYASINASEGIDENAMFADTQSVVDTAVVNVKKDNGQQAQGTEKTVGFSGSITSVLNGTASREYFTNGQQFDQTGLNPFIVGNFSLDVRLLQNFKTFASVEADYYPSNGTTTFSIPEIFLDANINRAVYFRAGKQVLQWGRCNFWNPTDLINVERKSFVAKIGARQGTYGIKAHAPFGTAANLYGFLDCNKVGRIDSVAGALKAEFLIKGTEMAFSFWDNRFKKPVYGFDMSAQAFKVNINNEIALYQQYILHKIKDVNGRQTIVTEKKKWVPRVCLGLDKTFGFLGLPDRVTLVGEFYYNYIGSTDKTITVPDTSVLSGNPTASTSTSSGQIGTEEILFFIQSGLYDPNNFSRFYAAFFTSFGHFIVSDMSLTVNALGNLSQHCALVTTGVDYSLLNGFSLGFSATGAIGPDNTEYVLLQQALTIQVTTKMVF